MIARTYIDPDRDHGGGGSLPLFQGSDLASEDASRLHTGLRHTIAVMRDGIWRTKAECQARIFKLHGTVVSSESIGRYLRYARERRNGGFTVDKRSRGGGLWEYRMGGGNGHS